MIRHRLWGSRRRRAASLFGLMLTLVAVAAILLVVPTYSIKRQPFYDTNVPNALVPAQLSLQSATIATLAKLDLAPEFARNVQLDMLLTNRRQVTTLARKEPGITWPSRSISVCWEPEAVGLETEKGWTRDAVAKSWEASSKVRFTGWGTCTDKAPGVHLKVADDPPEAATLGVLLNAVKDGVVLNFVMQKTTIPCGADRELCIREIAVHEFGHVLSFVHEDWQPGAPETCKDKRQGVAGIPVTDYDPHSVMNYCNIQYGNLAQLSELDKRAVNQLYP